MKECVYVNKGWCFYCAVYCDGKEKQDHPRCIYEPKEKEECGTEDDCITDCIGL